MIPAEEPWLDADARAVADADGSADRIGRLKKAPTAFRTISEVADDLHVPQHVLRFWETRFPQVKPLKRGGGRRYYRPDDVVLLRRISDLLYIQGYTIKGVQRLLVEGNGSLHGEMPPSDTADNPDAVDTEEAPGAIPGTASFEPADETLAAGSDGHASNGSAAADRRDRPTADDNADVRVLREAFRETLSVILAELEAIRRQLPA